MIRLEVSQGIDLVKVGVARDGQGAVMSGVFTGMETLAGVVWAGDDRAPLVTWAPTWNDAANGAFNVALSAAQTATLDVGTYTLSVKVADGSNELLRCLLEIAPSAGLADPLFSYISFQEMMVFSGGQVGRLQDVVSDETGFAEQRNEASSQFDAMVLARYQPVPGRSRRYADGVYRGFSGDAAPSRATIKALLGTDAVILNADVVECVAHLALSIIYLGPPGRDNPYRESGVSERSLGMQAFRRALVEIDTDNDGTADIRLDQDATFLT